MSGLYVPLLIVAVAASACSGPPPLEVETATPSTAEEQPASSTDGNEGRPADPPPADSDTQSVGIWAIDPVAFDENAVEEVDASGATGEPDEGEPADPSRTEEAVAPGDGPDPPEPDTVVQPLDPCSLITTAEWESMASARGRTVVLEAGDVCGYLSEGDLVRLAVGAFAWESGPRWATQLTPVEEVRPGVLWAEAYPVPESSTLVIELAGWDLVLEVSARDGRTADELRTALLPLAETAAGRLP